MLKETLQKIKNFSKNIKQILEFDDTNHIYYVLGEEYISVSSVIRPFNKDFNNKLNPNHKDYSKFLSLNMNKYIEKGKRIHSLTENYEREGIEGDWKNIENYHTYYKFFVNKYLKTNKWKIVAIELPIISRILKVAGTVDRLYLDTKNNEIILLDIKSGKTQDINTYQQAMYYQIFKENGINIDRVYLLSLKDGCNLKELSLDVLKDTYKKIDKYYTERGWIC